MKKLRFKPLAVELHCTSFLSPSYPAFPWELRFLLFRDHRGSLIAGMIFYPLRLLQRVVKPLVKIPGISEALVTRPYAIHKKIADHRRTRLSEYKTFVKMSRLLRRRPIFGLKSSVIIHQTWTAVLPPFNPLTAEWALRALIDFTQSNARRFYSSMGNPLDGKGLKWSAPLSYPSPMVTAR